MQNKFPRWAAMFTVLMLAFFSAAHAQTINVNQTEGFGKDKLLVFTYGQNFSLHPPAF